MWNQSSNEFYKSQNNEFLNYIGKLWKFMYLVLVQNSKIYHREMLWKIEDIGLSFQKILDKKESIFETIKTLSEA